MNLRVKIITCYFGMLPNYFKKWLESCGNNPTFNFLIVTDQMIEQLPQNVNLVIMNLIEFKKRLEGILGMDICLNSPYKICDYKPFFGQIFKEEIVGYDFWGHCDIDLIWGCLEEHITDEILNNFDVIGDRGHLILYRNNEQFSQLFKLEGSSFSYKDVCTSNCNFGFDEMAGMNMIIIKNGIKFVPITHADCIKGCSRVTIMRNSKAREFYCHYKNKVLRVSEDENNAEGMKLEEFAYIHFSGKKPALELNTYEGNNYYIRANSFRERMYSTFSLQELLKEGDIPIGSKEKKELFIYRMKRIYKLIFKFSLNQKYVYIRNHIYKYKNK